MCSYHRWSFGSFDKRVDSFRTERTVKYAAFARQNAYRFLSSNSGDAAGTRTTSSHWLTRRSNGVAELKTGKLIGYKKIFIARAPISTWKHVFNGCTHKHGSEIRHDDSRHKKFQYKISFCVQVYILTLREYIHVKIIFLRIWLVKIHVLIYFRELKHYVHCHRCDRFFLFHDSLLLATSYDGFKRHYDLIFVKW